MATYFSSCNGLSINSDELITAFERESKTPPKSLIDLREHGCRYANQDFDVMSNAVRLLAGGNNVLPVYQEISDLQLCACGHRRIGHLQGVGACLAFLSALHPMDCICKAFQRSRTATSSN